MGRLAGVHILAGLEEVDHGVGAQASQHQRVDGGDEGIGKHRVDLIENPVGHASAGGPAYGAEQEGKGQGHRDIAQLAVDDAAHDGLCEDVEQIGAHRKNALDAGGHQGWSDNEAAAGADAAGDEAGDQPYEDRRDEDSRVVRGRAIGFLSAQYVGQMIVDRYGHLVGKGHSTHDDGNQQQAQDHQTLLVAHDGPRDIQLPLGVSHRPGHHEPAHG